MFNYKKYFMEQRKPIYERTFDRPNSEIPKEKSPMPPMPGGMGGMDY